MKKHALIAFVTISLILLFSGCGAEPSVPLPSLSPSAENTPALSPPAVTGIPVLSEPDLTIAYEQMMFGGYVYYSGADPGTESGHVICRKNIDTDNVESIIYTASDIYSFGDNRYVDVYVSDDSLYPDWDTHWLTCKTDEDGNIQKIIGGDSVLLQYGDSLYYTIYGEDCIFKSGLDCSDPERIPVVPPENENPFENLRLTSKGPLNAIADLYSIEDGWMGVDYNIINEKNQCLYSVGYKISLSDYHVEKANPGGYYDSRIYKDSWLYYLDLDNPVESPDLEEPLFYIHRMKENGNEDENLNILCFSFDFAGEYLYTDTNLTFGDFGHWDTYRYDLNGADETKIKYGNMNRFSKGDRLYFSVFDETAFYSATTACTNVKKYEVKLPDEEAIREKVGDCWECSFVHVTDERDGWVYFVFEITDTGPETYYMGEYRMNLKSRKIEKVEDGEFYMDGEFYPDEGDGE